MNPSIGVPLAHSLSAAATCASVNFDFFMAPPCSRRPTKTVKFVGPKSSEISGADHRQSPDPSPLASSFEDASTALLHPTEPAPRTGT